MTVFGAIAAYVGASGWNDYNNGSPSWILSLVVAAIAALMAVFFVPIALAVTIYCAKDVYFVDTGKSRAAMATKPDTRRGALKGDVQGHSFGSWPRGAGWILGDWVRNQVHAKGGRLTGTALPGLTKVYLAKGMFVDGRRGVILTRVASKPRPNQP